MIHNRDVYLRDDVFMEPLINQWYAWVQLLPPAPLALNIPERHLKVMQSFVQSPDLHAVAVKNPAMRGGPFIDLDASRVDSVKALLEKMTRDTETQQAFAKAVRDLDALLAKKAVGFCLQELYPEVPELLRGFVELYYDRMHRPDFRLFEELLYASPVYDEGFQTVALQHFTEGEERPFVFSTPRFPEKGLSLPLPFRSKAYDALFKMREEARPLAQIWSILGEPGDEELFASFFTETPPKAKTPYTGKAPRVRYFGHACVLVEAMGYSILTDPFLAYDLPSEEPRYSFHDLPDHIDYVLITHGHHDHVMLETLLQLRYKIGTLVVAPSIKGMLHDPSLKSMLQHQGFENVVSLDEFETIELEIGRIRGIPFLGEHHDLQVGSKICYHLELAGHSLLFAADSCNFDHGVYQLVQQQIGDVDLLFLGMECDGAPLSWVYGPLITQKTAREMDRSRRGRGCDHDEAMALVKLFNCKQVLVYAMGAEPWVQYVLDVRYTEESGPIVHSNRLIETCREAGIEAERLYCQKEIVLRADATEIVEVR